MAATLDTWAVYNCIDIAVKWLSPDQSSYHWRGRAPKEPPHIFPLYPHLALARYCANLYQRILDHCWYAIAGGHKDAEDGKAVTTAISHINRQVLALDHDAQH
ncbi:hypothetical protein NMY22_g4296 [Coprinellus aureogranulatus]|nr:hypothetical protein NMY22_g4296 [Coprinellus aureogranulatus]